MTYLKEGNESIAPAALTSTCLRPLITSIFGCLAILSSSHSAAIAATPYDTSNIAAEDSPPQGSPPLLRGLSNMTAISGRVLSTDGRPLGSVLVVDGRSRTVTDTSGRFLLEEPPTGQSVMILDARGAVVANDTYLSDYGYYSIRVTAAENQTTQLPFTDWLPKIDHQHAVGITSPLVAPIAVSTPTVPGLELQIPKGAVITDPDGKLVTQVSITSVPSRRPPYPLPRNVTVPTYYTIQPGGSVLSSADGSWLGAQLIYPNFSHGLPGARATFWHYDPDKTGWAPYGAGKVSRDGQHIQPDQMTRIYTFDSAMLQTCGPPPLKNRPPAGPLPHVHEGGGGPTPPCGKGRICPPRRADPVDLATGLMTYGHTDLLIDDVIPIGVTRTYMGADQNQYSFGVGTAIDYDMYLSATNEYETASLVFPNGSSIPYTRLTNVYSPNDQSPYDAVYTTQTPGDFYHSYLRWNSVTPGWTITRTDGVVLFLGQQAPLQSITDRFGNKVTIYRGGGQLGDITQVSSPNGRFITFTWDVNAFYGDKIASATDDIGRTVQYGYDSSQTRLTQITDPNSGTTQIGWGQNSADGWWDLTTMEDPVQTASTSGRPFIYNVFTQTGSSPHQVQSQILFSYPLSIYADSTCSNLTGQGICYSFSYPTNAAGFETDITDSNFNVEKATFDQNYYEVLDQQATNNSTYEVDTTISRNAAEQVTDYKENSLKVDGAARDTHYTYDPYGNVQSITQMYGTKDADLRQYAYSPAYQRLTSVEDALTHTTTFTRPPPLEEVTIATDPIGNQTKFGSYNQQGQVGTIQDPAALTTTFTYDHGELGAVQDPLLNTTTFFTDAIGRRIVTVDALGNRWNTTWDAIDGVQATVDPLSDITRINYDADGNISSVLDANINRTVYSYTSLDQLATRTDPDKHKDTVQSYDGVMNLLQSTDRNGNTVNYTYDPMNRLSQASYADGSVVQYTWDAGNRLTTIADSAGNNISRTYNGLDEVLTEKVNIGGIFTTSTYTYDVAGNRKTFYNPNAPGQAYYYYDKDNRLYQLVQGSNTVQLSYDADSRYQQISLPNGYSEAFNFGASPLLQNITWSQGSNSGTLAYGYDADNRVTSKGLSYSPATNNPFATMYQSIQPAAVSGAVYDADNRLCAWNTTGGSCSTPIITWDNNGNLLNDGTSSYSWDSRNRLTAIPTLSLSFKYDAIGRRLSLTSSSSTTNFVYDGGNLVQKQVGGADYEDLLTGLQIDQTFSHTPTAASQQVHVTDALGSVLQTMSTSGGLVTAYSYDPYGVTMATSQDSANTIKYAGRESDLASGLYFNRRRYYNPAWGRFISEDPRGFNAGVNFYIYAGDRPLSDTDPLGLTDFTNGQTCGFLGQAYSEATSGPLAGLDNIASNSTGPYDFGYTQPDDTWTLGDITFSADEFGNFIAGYQAGAYDSTYGTSLAVPSVYAAGIGYHVLGVTKAPYYDPADDTGWPAISDGVATGSGGTCSNGNQSAGAGDATPPTGPSPSPGPTPRRW